MGKYVVFFRFTAEAASRFVASPADRVAAVRQAVESVGGSLDCSYWMLGGYDGLTIADIPGTQTAAALSLALTATGSFSRLETHPLIDPADYVQVGERARQVTFRPPGA